jgi:Transcriptional regulator
MENSPSLDGKKKRLSTAQRQEVLLKVAMEVFLEKGFETASLDDIIRRAGGSRRNIYTQFGGKEGLFKALVVQIVSQALNPMLPYADKEDSLYANLSCFASRLLSTLFSPAALALYRLAFSEGTRFPELPKVFFTSAPASAATCLAGLLESAKGRGEIECPDCQMAASQFIGMLRDNLHLEVLLRLRDAPDEQEKGELAKNAVRIFLDGLRKRKK